MRAHSMFSTLTTVLLSLASSVMAQDTAAITAPAEFRQDFEEGHISGWESYPPFQDSAFDPGFTCSRENPLPGSRFSLSRKVQIDYVSQYEIGFIRKVRLSVTDASTVAFSYRLKMYGDAKRFEAVLCGTDGKRYIFTTTPPADDEWHQVSIPIASFKDGQVPISPGAEIEAFYVLAYLERTNPDVAYKISLDNVAIRGEAPARFEILVPKSTVFEYWNTTVLHTHYETGGTIGLAVSLPVAHGLTSVTFSLRSPKGTEVCTKVPLSFSREKNLWEHSSLYTFSAADEVGRWKGMLQGKDGTGGHVETSFDVWLTNRSQPHPRMYFGADNLDFYKRRLEDPKWHRWFDTLSANAARLRTTSNLGSIAFGAETSSLREVPPTRWTLKSLAKVDLSVFDTTYLLPTLSHYYNIMIPAREMLYSNALLYALNGDADAGAYAKDALLAIAGWTTWTHPWFRARHQESYYPVGELGVRAAFCYDAVYSLLSPEERQAVQDGLFRNCILPVYQEYVVEDRIPSSTSNWIANSVSGALSCILAIYGDDRARGSCEPYFSGLLTKLEDHIRSTLDTSGAWGEGIGYQSFAYTNMLPTMTALSRILHVDLSSPGLLRSYLYFLYNSSSSEIFDVGDSHASLSSLSCFAWILTKTEDPVFRWLYRTGPREHALDFLFGREDGPALPPDSLPGSRLFPDIGGAQFRSGWTPDDRVMNFRCGAFVNHQHFHQGSFQLAAFGETLVPEAGVVNYYNDPWYQPYYIQAVGHNTVLLDRNPGSQRSGDYLHFVKAAKDRAAMKEFVGTDFYASATGELHRLYRGNLRMFERNIIFMQPEYFVVFDRLRSADHPHEYNWLLHFDDRSEVRLSGSTIAIERPRAFLLVKVLSPQQVVIEKEGAPTRFGVPITCPGYLQVSSAGKRMAEDFLVVLYPTKRDSLGRKNEGLATESLLQGMKFIQGPNFKGARIHRDDAEDEIVFRVEDGGENIHYADISTDGRFVTRTLRGGQMTLLAVHDAKTFTLKPSRSAPLCTGLSGTAQFTAAGTFHGEKAVWVIQSDTGGKISFRSVREPSSVTSNGRELSSFGWDRGDSVLTVSVAEGTTTIAIQY